MSQVLNLKVAVSSWHDKEGTYQTNGRYQILLRDEKYLNAEGNDYAAMQNSLLARQDAIHLATLLEQTIVAFFNEQEGTVSKDKVFD